MYRTDMTMEILKPNIKEGVFMNILGGNQTVKRIDVEINTDQAAQLYRRPKGKYITIEVRELYKRRPDVIHSAARSIASAINDLVKEEFDKTSRSREVLVVGLGNRGMTADALGHKTVEKLIVTRHIHQEMQKNFAGKFAPVCAFCPNVLGVTGIESYDVIKGVVNEVKPDFIITVDTLASRKTERISSAFQITNTGITPGSGVANHRFTLDKASLGVPVISVGVPLVVYASTIVGDVLEEAKKQNATLNFEGVGSDIISEVLGDLVVTPKEIDVIVKDCAFVIALAINLALHSRLNIDDALELMYC